MYVYLFTVKHGVITETKLNCERERERDFEFDIINVLALIRILFVE